MVRQAESIALFYLWSAVFAAHVSGFVVPQSNLPIGQRLHQTVLVEDVTEATETSTSNKKTSIPWPLDTEKYGKFNQSRDWAFAYSCTPPEACSSYLIDNVEGQVPADLQGTYYKVGPAKFERGGRRYEHVLDGDGFVAAFRINNGEVRYTGRFVETEYFLDEEADDKIKYRSTFGTQRKGGMFANAFDLTLKNVANTNVMEWGGRLFAFYEAGRPYELDRETLETLDRTDDGPFDGLQEDTCNLRGISIDQGGPIDQLVKVGRSFTAHPHIVDEDTLVAFMSTTNVNSKEALLEFIEYDRNWQQKKTIPFAFPKGPPPHDFAVSEDFYLFFENPYCEMENTPYLLGMNGPAQIIQVQLRQDTVLNLVPRTKGKKPLQFKVPPYFNIHKVGKAEEKDGKLTIYSNGWDLKDERFFPKSADSTPFLGEWGGIYPDFDSGGVPVSLMYRTVLDLESETILSHEEVFPGDVVEFPAQDERDPQKVYYSIATNDYTSIPATGFCQYDLEEAKAKYWWAENRIFTGEILPVSKKNGEAGSWLLGLLYDAKGKRTSLAIFDSNKFEEGPVCRLHLKHHISYAFHSSFAPLEENDR